MDVIVKLVNAGTTSMQGLDVTIENYVGELRHGKDWVQKMANDYGYINDTVGADGDEVDCFIGPNQDSDKIYIIEQQKENGEFDEHKVMLGFSNIAEAKDAYHDNYPEGWNGLKNISEIEAKDFWQHFNPTEKENAARGDREEEFEGWHEGLAGHQNIVVTKEQKDKRDKLVRDEEGYAGRPDFETRKDNSMQETYHVGNHNREALVHRGQRAYGSKVDNSACECPVCFGGGRRGLFACKNCKGEGVIRNAKKDLKVGERAHIPTGNAQLVYGIDGECGEEFEVKRDGTMLPIGKYKVVSHPKDTGNSGPWGSFTDIEVERLNAKDGGTCVTCAGTGKVKDKECKDCNGTGFEMSS